MSEDLPLVKDLLYIKLLRANGEPTVHEELGGKHFEEAYGEDASRFFLFGEVIGLGQDEATNCLEALVEFDSRLDKKWLTQYFFADSKELYVKNGGRLPAGSIILTRKMVEDREADILESNIQTIKRDSNAMAKSRAKVLDPSAFRPPNDARVAQSSCQRSKVIGKRIAHKELFEEVNDATSNRHRAKKVRGQLLLSSMAVLPSPASVPVLMQVAMQFANSGYRCLNNHRYSNGKQVVRFHLRIPEGAVGAMYLRLKQSGMVHLNHQNSMGEAVFIAFRKSQLDGVFDENLLHSQGDILTKPFFLPSGPGSSKWQSSVYARRGQRLGGASGLSCPRTGGGPQWNSILQSVVANPYRQSVSKQDLVASAVAELGYVPEEANKMTKDKLRAAIVRNRFQAKTLLGMRGALRVRIGTAAVGVNKVKQVVHPFFITLSSKPKRRDGSSYHVLSGEYCVLGVKYNWSPANPQRRVVEFPVLGYPLRTIRNGIPTVNSDGYPRVCEWQSVQGFSDQQNRSWRMLDRLQSRQRSQQGL